MYVAVCLSRSRLVTYGSHDSDGYTNSNGTPNPSKPITSNASGLAELPTIETFHPAQRPPGLCTETGHNNDTIQMHNGPRGHERDRFGHCPAASSNFHRLEVPAPIRPTMLKPTMQEPSRNHRAERVEIPPIKQRTGGKTAAVKRARIEHADPATTAHKTATTKPSTLGDQMFKSLGRHRKLAVQNDNKKEVLDENPRDKHALREKEIKEKAAEGMARALKRFAEMEMSKKPSQQKELAEKGSQGCPGRK
jgi:hypothetical protein